MSLDFGVPKASPAHTQSKLFIYSRRPTQRFARRAEPTPERLRPVISSKRPPRQSTPPPEYKPVDHSAAFILKNKRPDQEEDLLFEEESSTKEPFTGNALEWYLRRVDKSLDEGDGIPSPAAKAYYRASETQAGSQAVKGIGSAAGTAAKVGAGAVKAIAPVGKWAVMQGLSAAAGLLSSSGGKSKGKKDS